MNALIRTSFQLARKGKVPRRSTSLFATPHPANRNITNALLFTIKSTKSSVSYQRRFARNNNSHALLPTISKPKLHSRQNSTNSIGDAAVIKRLVPVDTHCSSASTGHIFADAAGVWSCMLNQTNIGSNNNKFYLMQLIESYNNDKYWIWVRYGRVGVVGSCNLTECDSLSHAKSIFEEKFREKTGNSWLKRTEFVLKKGKYALIDIALTDDDDKPNKNRIDTTVPSKLDKRVKKLIELIFNRKSMVAQMKKMNYDVQKMPLGKLKKSTLDKGYAVLKKIESALKNGKDDLDQLSSEFYTLIPHNYGRYKPPVINSTSLLIEKLQMLDTLTDIDIANKLEDESEEKQELAIHPSDARYKTLKTEIKVLDKDSERFKLIENYLKTSHSHKHDRYSLKVLDVFEIERKNERKKFIKHCEKLFGKKSGTKLPTNTRLLWHGSRVTNYVGILSKGLRIAPPEAPSTGYMFGKGIYFADMVSKSANYCHVDYNDSKSLDEDGESVAHTGLLLLCEVALGNSWELTAAKYVSDLDPQYQSVYVIGANSPEKENAIDIDSPSSDHQSLDFKVKVPLGPCSKTGLQRGVTTDLLHNEYIVYHPDQVVISYMVKVEFTPNRYHY